MQARNPWKEPETKMRAVELLTCLTLKPSYGGVAQREGGKSSILWTRIPQVCSVGTAAEDASAHGLVL